MAKAQTADCNNYADIILNLNFLNIKNNINNYCTLPSIKNTKCTLVRNETIIINSYYILAQNIYVNEESTYLNVTELYLSRVNYIYINNIKMSFHT